ncbi:hypothetical protein SDC9_169795 [bioreactor metagenome]|uniref:S1 motif domain-containing protein n=1 Tax=bioreactor metagenome TaxID=1076179 RepID=A0A645G8W2_9ZZZZ
MSLGHKQLEENPWDVFETIFTVGSIHEGTIIEMLDKGAVVSLPYGVEGFATPKHLVKEDNSQAQMDEKLEFKVIEFNKDAKRIIVSHSRIHEDLADDTRKKSNNKRASGGRKDGGNEAAAAIPAMEKTTLGDIEELAALKEKLDNQKIEALNKKVKQEEAAKEAKAAEAEAKVEEVKAEVVETVEETKAEEAPKAEEKAESTDAEQPEAEKE